MKRASIALLAALAFTSAASAQETDSKGRISIELNTAQTVEGACTLTFMITNGHAQSIDQAVYETVLFDTAGQVATLTLFDFGALPPALPRVRQFVVPQLTCEELGRVLINGANTCSGADLPDAACSAGLTITTRTAIEVIG